MRGTRSVSGSRSAQDAQALARGAIDQVLAVQVQDVEEERRQRRRVALAFHVGPAREPAAGDLERMGPAVRSECDRLPVQDRSPQRQSRHRLHDLGHAIGHVGERSSERAHLALGDVDLEADAVELPLDVGRVDPFERVGRVGRRLREHRVHGAKDGEPEAIETCLALGDRRRGHGPQIALEHQRPPNPRGGNPRRRGDPFHHASLERALPELAHQEPGQERLLGFGRAFEQRRELRAPGFLAPLAGSAPYPLERGVHLERLEGGSGRGRRAVAERRPADADRALRQPAREVGHRDRYLLRAKAAKARRDELGLGLARACLSDGRGRRDDLGQLHRSGPKNAWMSPTNRSGALCAAKCPP